MDPISLYISLLYTLRLTSGPFYSWVKNYISAFASEKGPTVFAVSPKLLSCKFEHSGIFSLLHSRRTPPVQDHEDLPKS